jgi:hypothetical protein
MPDRFPKNNHTQGIRIIFLDFIIVQTNYQTTGKGIRLVSAHEVAVHSCQPLHCEKQKYLSSPKRLKNFPRCVIGMGKIKSLYTEPSTRFNVFITDSLIMD